MEPLFAPLLERLATAITAAGVRYMVIGGQAVLQHGQPRLTEDIDITIDYRHFCRDFDPFVASGTALRKFREQVKESLRGYVHGVVRPYFAHVWSEQFGDKKLQIDVSHDGRVNAVLS